MLLVQKSRFIFNEEGVQIIHLSGLIGALSKETSQFCLELAKAAKKYGKISEDEKSILLSKSKPIVLISKIGVEEASPGLNTIGIFLPYTGLHHLLFTHLKSDALIMTSSNVPGSNDYNR